MIIAVYFIEVTGVLKVVWLTGPQINARGDAIVFTAEIKTSVLLITLRSCALPAAGVNVQNSHGVVLQNEDAYKNLCLVISLYAKATHTEVRQSQQR